MSVCLMRQLFLQQLYPLRTQFFRGIISLNILPNRWGVRANRYALISVDEVRALRGTIASFMHDMQ